MPVKDPCKAFACKIQACLKEHNFQESACQQAIEDMRECCRTWKSASYVCGGIDTSKKSEKTKSIMNQKKIVKKRGFAYRHPRFFAITCATAVTLIFFSKPIYDSIYNTTIIDPKTLESSRQRKN